MLIDDTIIARQSAAAGAMYVLAQRHEVMWRDGTTVQLHPVMAGDLTMIMHRAVELPNGQLLLIDLTRVVRALDGELRVTQERDQVGHVFYSLRHAFRSATPFLEAATRIAAGAWWPVGDGFVWHAAARAIDPQVLATSAMATAPAVQQPLWYPA